MAGMSERGFTVTDTAGNELGRATVSDGHWSYTSDEVESMVEGKLNLDLTDDQILTYFDGWSNGYLKTTLL